MDKLKLHTPDLALKNIDWIAERLPNCVTETKAEDGSIEHAIDFDLLRQELSADLVEGPQERYRLDWPGKREALATANAPIMKTLRPCREESVDFDSTKNLYIEGDNLEALKLLQETYLNKVKMIYIDPPYNTGNDFIYEDDFKESSEEYFVRSNQVDEAGNQLIANTEANGRFHSDWLTMMYSRLKLAKNLLTQSGLIFVSIDEAEISNLQIVLREVFGSDNHLATFVRRRRMSTGMRSTPLSPDHEYILCFGKSSEYAVVNGLRRTATDFPLHDDISDYRSTDLTVGMTREMRPNQFYRITDPRTENEYFPSDSRVWRFDRNTMQTHIVGKNIIWPDDDPGSSMTRPRFKTRLLPEEAEELCNPVTTWLSNQSESRIPFQLESPLNQAATREVRELFDVQLLEYPKPVRLLISLIHIGSTRDSIIVDFFSGSAATAHAVMQINAEDGGNRRHIMVQLPEATEEKSPAFKAGYKTIAEIGKERLRRAGAKIRAELEAQLEGELPGSDKHKESTEKLANLDTGFRVLKVATSNMADVYYQPHEVAQEGLEMQVENIKPDRGPEDLLFQVLLDWGVDLALPIEEETIVGKTVFFIDGNTLAASFDTGLDEAFVKELAKRQPLRAVFRDASFATDATKINIEQIFKALSPHTELKTL